MSWRRTHADAPSQSDSCLGKWSRVRALAGRNSYLHFLQSGTRKRMLPSWPACSKIQAIPVRKSSAICFNERKHYEHRNRLKRGKERRKQGWKSSTDVRKKARYNEYLGLTR